MQDIFHFYTEDWMFLQKSSREFSKYPKLKKNEPFRIEKLKVSQKFEVDLEG